jgi:hypothetical protein
VAEAPVGHQGAVDATPEGGEATLASDRRKGRGEERGVVVAEVGAQPGQAAQEPAPLDREGHEEEDLAGGASADHDGGGDAGRGTDGAQPSGQEAVRLEDGVVGDRFEGAPRGGAGLEGIVQGEGDFTGAGCSFRLCQGAGQVRLRKRRRAAFEMQCHVSLPLLCDP